MDRTDPEPVREALKTQGQWLRMHEEQMAYLRQELAESNKCQEAAFTLFASQLSHLTVSLQQGESTTPPSKDPVASSLSQPQTDTHSSRSPESTHLRLSSPERFSGELGDCRPFLTQCELHFEFQAAAFPSHRSKIAYMISFMSG